jgi:hypothetical protein
MTKRLGTLTAAAVLLACSAVPSFADGHGGGHGGGGWRASGGGSHSGGGNWNGGGSHGAGAGWHSTSSGWHVSRENWNGGSCAAGAVAGIIVVTAAGGELVPR